MASCALLTWGVGLAQQKGDVPYVPTPWNVVDTMLDMARVSTSDYLVDLGSGDGRIVIEAAKKHGALGMGVDLDANLVSIANHEAERQGVAGRVSFVSGNLFDVDISRATVLTLYLLPHINLRLRPRILSELRPGTRVVSHDFGMEDWQPDQRREIPVPGKPYGPPVSQIYLWYVPANVAGTWRWHLTVGGSTRVYEARVNQFFQEFDGEVSVDGGVSKVQNARLRGELISFTLAREFSGRQTMHEFSGRIEGDKALGRVRLSGAGNATVDWMATRIQRGKMRIE